MDGVASVRVGYDNKGKKYGFIVYGKKSEYLFTLLSGEPFYNSFIDINGEILLSEMFNDTRLIESYLYNNDREFLEVISKARKDWMLYNSIVD